MSQIYLILGTPGSGRRQILLDLIENGMSSFARAYISKQEDPSSTDKKIDELKNAELYSWEWIPGIPLNVPSIESAPPVVFLVLESRSDLIDQLESFRDWLSSSGQQLARVITVVDCKSAKAHAELCLWFGACIHFSDYVLLNHRQEVSDRWIKAFKAKFEKECYPCLFGLIKKGRVRNPAEVLEPQARRLSLIFDAFHAPSNSTDHLNTQIFGPSDVDQEIHESVEDPYFARLPGGKRRKPLPNSSIFA